MNCRAISFHVYDGIAGDNGFCEARAAQRGSVTEIRYPIGRSAESLGLRDRPNISVGRRSFLWLDLACSPKQIGLVESAMQIDLSSIVALFCYSSYQSLRIINGVYFCSPETRAVTVALPPDPTLAKDHSDTIHSQGCLCTLQP